MIDLTEAAEVAVRALYERAIAEAGPDHALLGWDDLPDTAKHSLKEQFLPAVVALAEFWGV